MPTNLEKEALRQAVMENYAAVANSRQGGCCSSGPEVGNCCGAKSPSSAPKKQSCCSTKKEANFDEARQESSFAINLGYSANDLKDLPEGANMGLSCGNPTAMASLKEGDTVLDLGSGGGFDVFVAARKVGATGRSMGVDMTPAMIRKARSNSVKFTQRTGLDNVEFRLGEIEHLPVADNSVDVVISNCVINLSPDKPQVWKEVARVLKPGGRACVSDVALLQPLPPNLRDSMALLVGCVANAVPVDDTVAMVGEAGLVVTSTERESAFVEEMEKSEDPLYKNVIGDLPEGAKASDYATSLKLVATKPAV